MNTMSRTTHGSKSRVKIGAAVLHAAELVDTRLVAPRLQNLKDAYQAYLEAERTVDAAEARLDSEKLTLTELGAAHDDAVEGLARCLVNEGHSRTNPFDAFDVPSPSLIKRMPPAEAARAVRSLLATLERSGALSTPTREAGERVEQMTQLVEAALPPYQTRLDEVRAARRVSDVVGGTFDEAVAALRRAARAARDDGAPGLYAALFPTPPRPSKKPKPTAPTAAPSEAPPSSPTI